MSLHPVFEAAIAGMAPPKAKAIPADSQETLDTIERCLVGDAASVKAALLAAYRLGAIDALLGKS